VYTNFVTVEVGIRALRANLSSYLDRVKAGEDVLVTERGKPVARITNATGRRRLDELIAAGVVRPPLKPRSPIRVDKLPRMKEGSLSDIVLEQRGKKA
jgi:prevent-host-death family protein